MVIRIRLYIYWVDFAHILSIQIQFHGNLNSFCHFQLMKCEKFLKLY